MVYVSFEKLILDFTCVCFKLHLFRMVLKLVAPLFYQMQSGSKLEI